MMKRKILAVTIPVVGCITVVGSGFSAWYFSEATGGATDGLGFGVNVNVTEEVKDTSSTLLIQESNSETIKAQHLILDQGGFSNKTDATKGIMFAQSAVNETIDRGISYTFNLVFDGDTDLTLNKIYDAKMEVALSVSFDLGDGLGAYLETAEGASLDVTYTTVTDPYTKTQEISFDRSDNAYTAEFVLAASEFVNMSATPITDFTWKIAVDLSTKDLKNALLKYAKKPQTGGVGGELEKMADAVASSTLKFTTSASIREKKTSN